jgi:hypothetical protein
MFVGTGHILYHIKAFILEITFEEADKVFTKVQINFSGFENLTCAFSIKIPTFVRICVNPVIRNELILVLDIFHILKIWYAAIGNETQILPLNDMVNAVIIMSNSDHWKSLNWIGDNIMYCANRVSLLNFCKSVSEKRYFGIENFYISRVISAGQSLLIPDPTDKRYPIM